MARFNRSFAERHPDRIRHLTHATVKSLDPFARVLHTEFDELRFDDAIIIPPQRAGRLAQQAGLLEAGPDGRPGAWVALDPLALHVPGDAWRWTAFAAQCCRSLRRSRRRNLSGGSGNIWQRERRSAAIVICLPSPRKA